MTDEILSKIFNQYRDLCSTSQPSATNILFLLRYWKTTNNKDSLDIIIKTLDNLYKGSLFDHVGLGFHQGTLDKNLYDNALYTIAYLEAYQATSKVRYANIAEKILSYIMRKLTSKEGYFYTAELSNLPETYLWTKQEIINILEKEDGEFFCQYYNIKEKGNYKGKSIPTLAQIEDIENISAVDEFRLSTLRQKLFDAREKRPQQEIDTSIQISINALTTIAFSMANRIINEKIYQKYAETTYNLIEKNTKKENAPYLTWASIELYETTHSKKYLKKALSFSETALELLDFSSKTINDNILQDSESITILNLLKLSRFTDNKILEQAANTLLDTFEIHAISNPTKNSILLMAFLFSKIKTREITIKGKLENIDTLTMLQTVYDAFLPYTAIHFQEENTTATAYIQEGTISLSPITDISNFQNTISPREIIQ